MAATGPRREPRTNRNPTSGFTLLELLVVIVIFAILTSTVVLGFSGADEDQELRGMAERISTRMELARQYSLQRNREWGVFVQADSYRFAELDSLNGQWIEQSYRPFIADGLNPRISFRVQVEGFDEEQFDIADDDFPEIVIFSSGEMTPFQWHLMPVWDGPAWMVSSDGLAPSSVTRQARRR